MPDHDFEAPRVFATFRFRDAPAMIAWLERAFGFRIHACYMDGERVAHAELALGSSMIMCGSDRDNAYGAMVGEPGKQGGKSIYVAVDDADEAFAHAREAGADILQPPVDTDHGSREFICADPEGNVWCLGTYWPKTGNRA